MLFSAIAILASVTFTAPKFAAPQAAHLLGSEGPIIGPVLATLYGSREDSDQTEILAEETVMPGHELTLNYNDRGYRWSLWLSYALVKYGGRSSEPNRSLSRGGIVELTMNAPVIQTGSIKFAGTLPLHSRANLKIFDIAGRIVARPYIELYPGGGFAASWDSPRARPGVYFARLDSDQGAIAKRVILIK